MADKAFGSVVMGVVVDVFKQDPVNVDRDGPQYNQARRYAIDAMEDIRRGRFRYNAFGHSFATSSGVKSYDLEKELDLHVVEVNKVKYIDSDGNYLPAGKDGILSLSWPEVRSRSLTNTTSGVPECYALGHPVKQDEQWILVAPTPDGSYSVAVWGIWEPHRFTYDIKGDAWVYSLDGSPNDDIDSEQSPIFTHAGKLLRYLTNANLYAGPLEDERGRRQEKWRALYQNERERMEREKEALDNSGGVDPYI